MTSFTHRTQTGRSPCRSTKTYQSDWPLNITNEITQITVTDSAGPDTSYVPTHDAVGNLTDDGRTFTYEYDAFGRLRKVRNRGAGTVRAEYTYNGLGHRIGILEDTNGDGIANNSDTRFYQTHNERWQLVAVYRANDADAKEQYVHHAAGLAGRGGSSYFDAVIGRQRDTTNGPLGAADGTFDEEILFCQNWRNDVVALLEYDSALSTWIQVEQVRYSAYGVPFLYPAGDADSDGDADAADQKAIQAWIDGGLGSYNVRGDLDVDGDVDATDKALAATTITGGWNTLSKPAGTTGTNNRLGYAGYVWSADTKVYHIRHRAYRPDLGRWTRRDPLGYVDGLNLYAYVRGNPAAAVDPMGLSCSRSCVICIAGNIALVGSCAVLCKASLGAGCYFCLLGALSGYAQLLPDCEACLTCLGNLFEGSPPGDDPFFDCQDWIMHLDRTQPSPNESPWTCKFNCDLRKQNNMKICNALGERCQHEIEECAKFVRLEAEVCRRQCEWWEEFPPPQWRYGPRNARSGSGLFRTD